MPDLVSIGSGPGQLPYSLRDGASHIRSVMRLVRIESECVPLKRGECIGEMFMAFPACY